MAAKKRTATPKKKAATPKKETATPKKKAATPKKSAAPKATATKSAFPHVPAEWSETTSMEHWLPSKEARAEIAALLKAAVKLPRPKQFASWKRTTRLLPPELREILGDNAPGWGSVASPEVADVAMALIRHAAQPGADVARVYAELERILPDVPMVCLNGVVDGKSYMAATAAIDRIARIAPDNPHLSKLQIFLISS